MSESKDLKYILDKIDELSLEVEKLKKSGEDSEATIQSEERELANLLIEDKNKAFFMIASQLKEAILALGVADKDSYISHTILKDENKFETQISWLEVLLEDDSKSMAKFCLALSNEHRINILKSLAKGPKPSSEIAEYVGIEGGPLYHHLKELINARFVEQIKRSKYGITKEGFDAFLTIGAMNRRNTWEKNNYWREEGDFNE